MPASTCLTPLSSEKDVYCFNEAVEENAPHRRNSSTDRSTNQGIAEQQADQHTEERESDHYHSEKLPQHFDLQREEGRRPSCVIPQLQQQPSHRLLLASSCLRQPGQQRPAGHRVAPGTQPFPWQRP